MPHRIPALAVRTTRLFLVSTVAALAMACQDGSSPVEPPAPADEGPSAEAVPTRQELAALVGGPRYWADGFAWVEATRSGPYNPSPYSSYNRGGGPITITKTAGTIGRYVVTFRGLSQFLGSRSTVRVTAENADGLTPDTYCKPVTAYLVNDKVEVQCFRTSTRTASNAAARVMVTRNYADLAFAYAHRPTSGSYNASARGTWNPGGATRVNRLGVGHYEVVFEGLGAELGSGVAGHVQVNAVGTDNAHCKVRSWGGTTSLSTTVLCFTPAGQPVDAAFAALFVAPTDHLAYTWAEQPSSASYTPLPQFSSNPSGGAIAITRLGVGRYQISWVGSASHLLVATTIQVTAYGPSPAQCRVDTPAVTGEGVAQILCVGPNGSPVDATYTALTGS